MVRTETSPRYVFHLLPVWLVFGVLLTGCAHARMRAEIAAQIIALNAP